MPLSRKSTSVTKYLCFTIKGKYAGDKTPSNKSRFSALKWHSHPDGVGAKIVDPTHAKIWKL
jgi:hypothetical protein